MIHINVFCVYVEVVEDPDQDRYQTVASIFEAGNYAEASSQYLTIKEDSTISSDLRSKSCFNHAWLNDYFLFDKTAALESYNYLLANFPDDPLALTARDRVNALTQDAVRKQQSTSDEQQEDDNNAPEQDRNSEQNIPDGDNQGEKE